MNDGLGAKHRCQRQETETSRLEQDDRLTVFFVLLLRQGSLRSKFPHIMNKFLFQSSINTFKLQQMCNTEHVGLEL
jgi:hypothetical protein